MNRIFNQQNENDGNDSPKNANIEVSFDASKVTLRNMILTAAERASPLISVTRVTHGESAIALVLLSKEDEHVQKVCDGVTEILQKYDRPSEELREALQKYIEGNRSVDIEVTDALGKMKEMGISYMFMEIEPGTDVEVMVCLFQHPAIVSEVNDLMVGLGLANPLGHVPRFVRLHKPPNTGPQSS